MALREKVLPSQGGNLRRAPAPPRLAIGRKRSVSLWVGQEIQELLRASGGETMIRAIIFDWGGVIQRTADYGPRRRLDEELGLRPGTVERAVFASRVWQLASTGRCPADEAWTIITRALRVRGGGHRPLCRAVLCWRPGGPPT